MISVCMATYNGEKYLRQQLDSILVQLSEQDEIVISDDGSTDKTIEILKSYKDTRIKVFNNIKNHGVNSNFENALQNAYGNYIFLSDQDDVWLPGKIEACVNALNSVDCVIHDAIITNAELKIIAQSFFAYRRSGNGLLKNIVKNTYLGCCMAFRRELLPTVLPIPNTTRFYHDNWIGLLADWKFNLRFIPFKGIYFRRHESNTSYTAKTSKYSRMRQLTNRLSQFWLTYKRIKSFK